MVLAGLRGVLERVGKGKRRRIKDNEGGEKKKKKGRKAELEEEGIVTIRECCFLHSNEGRIKDEREKQKEKMKERERNHMGPLLTRFLN